MLPLLHVLISVILPVILTLGSCKMRSGELSSIDQNELAKCGVFNGKRLLFTINPDEDFSHDVDMTHKLFLKQMTQDNRFTQFSYFTDEEGKISEPCAFYVQNQQAKYELGVPPLLGKSATREQLAASIKALGDRIRAIRKEVSFSLPKEQSDSFQIQIMLAVTSHGDQMHALHPEGVIALAPPKKNPALQSKSESGDVDLISYTDFIQLVSENLFTKCNTSDCVTNSDLRLADEVTFLIDNCFSGKFQGALKQRLSSELGYHKTLAWRTPSNATRIFSFTASQANLVAPSSYLDTGRSTLFELLSMSLHFWMGDKNQDNLISMAELSNFITVESEPAMLAGLVQDLGKEIASIFQSKAALNQFLIDYRYSNRQAYDALFANPQKALSKYTYMENTIGLQKPSAFSNVSPETLENLYFAVRGKSDFGDNGDIHPETVKSERRASIALLKDLVKILRAVVIKANENPKNFTLDANELDLGGEKLLLDFILSTFSADAPNEEPQVEAIITTKFSKLIVKKAIEPSTENEIIYRDGAVVSESQLDPNFPHCRLIALETIPGIPAATVIDIFEGYIIAAATSLINFKLNHPQLSELTCKGIDNVDEVAAVLGDHLELAE